MTSTDLYNKKPLFYSSEAKCIVNKINKKQSNPEYKNFQQDVYHAATEEQFVTYCNTQNKTVLNTFRYMFYKFKKGIFIKITNNKLDVFLPFSNAKFENEWHHNIEINPNYEDVNSFLKYICKLSGYRFNKFHILQDKSKWYSNNGLLRYENPISENDTNINCLKHMFQSLCETLDIPDSEFFINKRDFPIITVDKTEPYNHIWGSISKQLVSYKSDEYSKILSMSTSSRFKDIPIPTADDWALLNKDKYFPTCRVNRSTPNTNWSTKISTAVFRGSSTGIGTTVETNKRLKLAQIDYNENDNNYLDAGITSWNVRPRKHQDSKYVDTINIYELDFKLKNYMNFSDQTNFKYIINVDGHNAAFRLTSELGSGSVVLLVESEWKMWIHKHIQPYKHYVPVKHDMSDLIDIIKWCRENDDLCFEIAQNAICVYNNHLSINSLLNNIKEAVSAC
jgi:hypothetical protein